MNSLLRKWLDEKHGEFNFDGYEQKTLDALNEFANYVATQQNVSLEDKERTDEDDYVFGIMYSELVQNEY